MCGLGSVCGTSVVPRGNHGASWLAGRSLCVRWVLMATVVLGSAVADSMVVGVWFAVTCLCWLGVGGDGGRWRGDGSGGGGWRSDHHGNSRVVL